MNLDAITLGRVMIHDIPRGGADAEPTLTDTPARLDDGLRRYFLDKLKSSLSTRGVDIVGDPDADTTVTAAVTRILRRPVTLAAQSREIATRLTAAQTGHNPPGLLVVIEATAGDTDAVVIMKLERESGVRFDITQTGRYAVVNLELLRQLTLTNKTRVFKTAVMTAAAPFNAGDVSGRASDNQRGLADGRGVADFYLGQFLGCVVALNPARTTQQFAQTVTDFINTTDLTAETRGRYTLALLAELQSNNLDISPRTFVTEHIAAADRPALNAALRANSLDPGVNFEKDGSLIRYEKIRIAFDSGIVLVGSGADVREHVRFRRPEEPPGLEVNDMVESVNGR